MKLPRLPSFRLDGQQALVTGASSGIGLAAAAALAEVGARVTLVARHGPALQVVADAIRARGGQADVLALDITDLDATREALAERAPFPSW